MIMGITISFAGIPRIKASKMVPSRPKSRAKGSKHADIQVRKRLPSCHGICHKPDKQSGRNGSSNCSCEYQQCPMDNGVRKTGTNLRFAVGRQFQNERRRNSFKTVLERSQEEKKVISTPKRMTQVSSRASQRV